MSESSKGNERRCVLVVDDAPENIEILAGILRGEYKVRVANSGERALQIIQSNAPPDLVLLDVMMPVMDGYEVIRRAKSDPRSRDIPILIVSAAAEPANEETALALGAIDFLAKPVIAAVVRARVKAHLALSDRTRMLRELSDKLSHYLSPQIYQLIFQGEQDVTVPPKRRELTIFFSDLKDFTQTTEDLQPEDMTYLLNSYLDEMSSIALEYGATIDKFIGDAMLIFFGDPESQGVKEDALRCVRMAISMQRRMADLQARWRDRGYENPLRMRVGINTGFCHVGNFGSTRRMDYTVIGAEVNLASRLEQACEPDGILLSFETFALVQDEIRAVEQPLAALKGIHREVRSFAVSGILDGVDHERRYVHKSRPGLRAVLDLDALPASLRDTAIGDLEDLIARIRAGV